MIIIFSKLFLIIKKEYKNEFFQEIYLENCLRIIICAIPITIIEIVIFLLHNNHDILKNKNVIIFIIIFNAILIPILFTIYKKFNKAHNVKAILLFYQIGMLFLACAMSLMIQSDFASINVYIIALFIISAFIFTPPLESIILYFSVYILFFFLLPFYQINPLGILILRSNAFIMTLLAWLLSRMVYRLKIKSFINYKTIEEKNTQLQDCSIRDSMTSLLNHASIYKKLEEEVERVKNNKCKLCIAMIDIDDFKMVNDNFGHIFGDCVLVELSKLLIQSCRITDFVGRYGGEEFILVLPNTSQQDAFYLVERIRSNIEDMEFENKIHITVSVGFSEYKSGTAKELIHCADNKLYQAKHDGKNNVVI